MKKYFSLLVCLLSCASVMAQGQREVRSLDRSGNSHFRAERYQVAELDYRRALDINSNDSVARFNLATTLISQKDEAKLQEADSILTGMLRDGVLNNNHNLMARTLYQKGEIAMMAQQYQQAADAFKESLKLDPTNNDARYNYILAKKLLENQQNQDQNQQNQDQQQQQQNQQQEQKQQEQQEQQNQNQDQQNQDQQQQQEQQQQQMSEDQRQSILEQNEREEKETQAKVMRRQQEKDKDKQREREIQRLNGTLKDW